MPPIIALAPVQPIDGDGRVGAALSHIGGKSPRSMAVILRIIWRAAPAPCRRRLWAYPIRSMSGHHPRNVQEYWAEDAKPDKMIARQESGSARQCWQNRRGLRHIAFKEHRQLMSKHRSLDRLAGGGQIGRS